VDVNDVLVADRGGGLSLASEAFPSRRGRRQLRRHDLHGHDALQDLIEGFQDHPHTALANDG
jgi:hypothetical protein